MHTHCVQDDLREVLFALCGLRQGEGGSVTGSRRIATPPLSFSSLPFSHLLSQPGTPFFGISNPATHTSSSRHTHTHHPHSEAVSQHLVTNTRHPWPQLATPWVCIQVVLSLLIAQWSVHHLRQRQPAASVSLLLSCCRCSRCCVVGPCLAFLPWSCSQVLETGGCQVLIHP